MAANVCLSSLGLKKEMVAEFLFEESEPCSQVLAFPTLPITLQGLKDEDNDRAFAVRTFPREPHSLMLSSLGQFPGKEICKHLSIRYSSPKPLVAFM